VVSFPPVSPPRPYTSPLSSPIRATCPAHLIHLDFITRKILGEQYKSFSSSLCNLLHSPVTSSLLGPNQLDALISLIYFWSKTLHVSDSSSVHHQEFFSVHTAMVRVYIILLASRIMTFRPDPARKLSAKLYDIYHCCVYTKKLLMMDTGTVRNM